MYFQNFPSIIYGFDKQGETEYQILTDITANIRFKKNVLENISLYDLYDIQDGETPEIISEKVYGTPFYHWVIMLANQRYDYINDFPLSASELDNYAIKKYGLDYINDIHHYKKDGYIVEGVNTLVLENSNRNSGDSPIETLVIGDILMSESGYMGRIDSVVTPSNGTSITVSVSIMLGRLSSGDHLRVNSHLTAGSHQVYVTSSSIPSDYSTVSNSDWEITNNESKRTIKIIDPSLVEQLVSEFKSKI